MTLSENRFDTPAVNVILHQVTLYSKQKTDFFFWQRQSNKLTLGWTVIFTFSSFYQAFYLMWLKCRVFSISFTRTNPKYIFYTKNAFVPRCVQQEDLWGAFSSHFHPHSPSMERCWMNAESVTLKHYDHSSFTSTPQQSDIKFSLLFPESIISLTLFILSTPCGCGMKQLLIQNLVTALRLSSFKVSPT